VKGTAASKGGLFLWALFMSLTNRNPVESEVDLFARILSIFATRQKHARCLRQSARRICCKSVHHIKHSVRNCNGTPSGSCTSSEYSKNLLPQAAYKPILLNKNMLQAGN